MNMQASGGVEKDVLESYCWMYSTWSIPPKYKGVCSAHGVSQKKGKFQLIYMEIRFTFLSLH